MKKIWLAVVTLSVSMLSSALLAAPGEWWEITGKMEMPGMPFAMPGQTSKVCLPKGGESDPRYTQGKDSNCKMSDVKQSGNTVKYKGTCVNQGETMNVAGETTHDGNSFKSNMKMTGKSHGEPVNMTMVSTGKRIGGNCDSEEMAKKAQAQGRAYASAANEQNAKMCNTSKYKPIEWVNSSQLFIGDEPYCRGKKEALCKVLRNDVPRDVDAFEALKSKEQTEGMPSAVKACNLSMESMKKTLCKTQAKKGPLSFLEANCPAEAKTFRELERKRAECEGRGFTSGAKIKKCMGSDWAGDEAADGERPAKSKKSKADAESDDSGSSSSDTVLQGAKKLKGLFGF